MLVTNPYIRAASAKFFEKFLKEVARVFFKDLISLVNCLENNKSDRQPFFFII